MKTLQYIAKPLAAIFFVGVLLFLGNEVKAQKIYFSDSTNHWQVVEHYTPHLNTLTYYYDYWYGTITSINGKDYRLIKSTLGDSTYVREDTTNGLVYYFDQYNYVESILYNYNLKSRDTIIYNINGNLIIDTATFIDSILINGLKYKQINFECANYAFFRLYTVLQGIGCLSGPYFPLSYGACSNAGSQDFELYCFSEKNICPYFSVPLTNNCALLPIINTPTCFPLTLQNPTSTHKQLQFYPSPFTNTLSLQNAMAGISYRLYDITGRCICKGITTNDELVLQTNDWDEGTYIAELVLPAGNREVRKVVK